MADVEPAVVSSPSRSSGASAPPDARAKRQLIAACATIAGGLAIAGSIDRTTGGVLLLFGWLLGVAALHRFGRAGSERSAH